MNIIKNKKKTMIGLFLIAISILMMFSLNSITVHASSVSTQAGFMDAFNKFFGEYKTILMGVLGFCLLTCIGVFIYHFCQLSASASNPQKRAEAIRNILITGVCVGLLGAVPLIAVLLFNVTKWK